MNRAGKKFWKAVMRERAAVRQLLDSARHEAAHAVVGVRLGLPMASTDIKRRSQSPNGRAMVARRGYMVRPSLGYTTIVEGTAERWQDALPDPATQDGLERLAAQCAAGIVAEVMAGREINDPSCYDDAQQLVQIAGGLGLGRSDMDEPVRDFTSRALQRAGDVLGQDDGAGWDNVTRALLKRESLTGDEVRAILSISPVHIRPQNPGQGAG